MEKILTNLCTKKNVYLFNKNAAIQFDYLQIASIHHICFHSRQRMHVFYSFLFHTMWERVNREKIAFYNRLSGMKNDFFLFLEMLENPLWISIYVYIMCVQLFLVFQPFSFDWIRLHAFAIWNLEKKYIEKYKKPNRNLKCLHYTFRNEATCIMYTTMGLKMWKMSHAE